MTLQYKKDAALQTKLHDELARLVSQDGNKVCADCGAVTPKWSSVNLGVFICMRCAGIHRSLGTHITKVRSITLDTFTEEQVAVLRKVGNINAATVYEAQNHDIVKNPEIGQRQLERYIRDKYEHKKYFSQKACAIVYSEKGQVQSIQQTQTQQTISPPQKQIQSQPPRKSQETKQKDLFDFTPKGTPTTRPQQSKLLFDLTSPETQSTKQVPKQSSTSLFDTINVSTTEQVKQQPKQSSTSLFDTFNAPSTESMKQPKQQTSFFDTLNTQPTQTINSQNINSSPSMLPSKKVDYMDFYKQPVNQQYSNQQYVNQQYLGNQFNYQNNPTSQLYQQVYGQQYNVSPQMQYGSQPNPTPLGKYGALH
ncbi:Gtpase activating protein [Entamoeba marina]